MTPHKKRISQLVFRSIVIGLAVGFASTAHANPIAPTVVSGSATIATSGNTMTVTNTPGAIINWQQFNIGQSEVLKFIQQSAQSSVLNRVISQNPSQILGTLQSNGRVFLINPSGVMFGQGSIINVNGLVASTLNISDSDFLLNRFNFIGSNSASVINKGEITTPLGGSVYLIGNSVSNEGVITSPKGEVILAAGNSVSLLDTGTPHVTVTLNAPDNQAVNLGQIVAEGGKVNIYGALLSQQGLISADSASLDAQGNIVLKASQSLTLGQSSVTTANGPQGGTITAQASEGKTTVSGRVETTGNNGSGGSISLLGNEVALTGTARIDASGSVGGGTVLVGGDYQGKNAAVQNAQVTYLAQGASIKADAVNSGEGGRVILWADEATGAFGNISAKGGALGGNGGFVEVSGKEYLEFDAQVDTSAPFGNTGTLLLDPTDITIVGGSNPETSGYFSGGIFYGDIYNSSTISWGRIEGLLASSNVIIQTGSSGYGAGNITVSGSPNSASLTISHTSPWGTWSNTYNSLYNSSNNLYLVAENAVNINAPFGNAGSGAITIFAGWNGSPTTPDLVANYTQGKNINLSSSNIITNTGALTLKAADSILFNPSSNSATIDMNTGALTLVANKISLDASAAASNTRASIQTNGDQSFTIGRTGGASSDGLYLLGANGDDIYGGQAEIRRFGGSGGQSFTFNNGSDLILRGGAGNGLVPAGSWSGDCASGNCSGNNADIDNYGSGNQTFTFSSGSSLKLYGGSRGNNNGAWIDSSTAQVISGNPAITLTGGDSGGIMTTDGYVFENNAGIESNVSQTINAASITMQGGGANYGGAYLVAPAQTITVAGNVSLTGGNAAVPTAFDHNGDPVFTTGVAIGDDDENSTSHTLTLSIGGNLTLQGGPVNTFGGSHAMIGGFRIPTNLTIETAGNIDLTGAGAGRDQIGSYGGFGGNVSLRSLGNIALGQGFVGTGTAGTTLIEAQGTISQAVGSNIKTGNLDISSLNTIDIDGDITATGTFSATTPGGLFVAGTIGANMISYRANDMDLAGSTTAVNRISIASLGSTRNLRIESSPTTGVLSLSPTEIDSLHVTGGSNAEIWLGALNHTPLLTVASALDSSQINGNIYLYGNQIAVNAPITVDDGPQRFGFSVGSGGAYFDAPIVVANELSLILANDGTFLQSANGSVSANTLKVRGSGAIFLDDAPNRISKVAADLTRGFWLKSSSSLQVTSLDSASGTINGITAAHIGLVTDGTLTLNAPLTATSTSSPWTDSYYHNTWTDPLCSGDCVRPNIELHADTGFINNVGSSAFSLRSGTYWALETNRPGTTTLNGLVPDAVSYDASQINGDILLSANRIFYQQQDTATTPVDPCQINPANCVVKTSDSTFTSTFAKVTDLDISGATGDVTFDPNLKVAGGEITFTSTGQTTAGSEITKAEGEIKQAEIEIKMAKTPKAKAQAEMKKSEAEGKKAEAEAKKAEAEAQQAEVEEKTAKTPVEKAKAEMKKTEAEGRKAEAESRKAEAEAKKAEVEAKQAEGEGKKAEAEAKLAKTPEDKARAEKTAEASKAEAEGKKAEVTAKKSEAEAKKSEAEVKKAEIEEKTAKTPVEKAKAEVKKTEAEGRKAEAESRKAEAEAKKAEVEGKQAEGEGKKAEAEAKLAKTPEDKARAEKTAEASKAEAEGKKAEVTAKKSEAEAKKSEAEVKKAEIEEKTAKTPVEKAKAEVKKTEAEGKQAEAESRKADAEAKKAEIEGKQAEGEAKGAKSAEKKVAEEKKSEFKKAEAEAKKAESETKKAEAEEKKGKLEAKSEKSEEKKAEAEKKLENKKAEESVKKAEAQKKESEYKKAEAERKEAGIKSFGKAAVAAMSKDHLKAMLDVRHEYKTDTLKPALTILDRNPAAADMSACGPGESGACIQQPTAQIATSLLPPPAISQFSFLPQIQRKVAVVIGVNKYQDKTIPALEGAVPDANAVSKMFKENMGYEIRVIHDGTKSEIVQAINKVAGEVDANDSVTIYYAGHGYEMEATKTGYWIPSDGSAKSPANWISSNDINKMLSNIKAKQVLLVSDSCFSGNLAKEQKVSAVQSSADDILGKRSVLVMSSGGDEPVSDEGREGHSVFAWHFMDKLKGINKYEQGSKLYEGIKTGVIADGFPQTPQYGASVTAGHSTGGDYLFEVRK